MARLGECKRIRDLGFDFLFDVGANSRGKLGRDAMNRIGSDPRFALGLISISQLIIMPRADMFAPAIGAHFEEPRPLTATDILNHSVRAVQQTEYIRPIEFVRRQAKRFSAAANIRSALPAILLRMDRITVILTDK
jgi:hypothetical protein